MKKETTLSRWDRYKKVVEGIVIKDIEGDDVNERMEEVLSAALALEVCSNALTKLAMEWGNEYAHEDVMSNYEALEPIATAFSDLMVTDISLALQKKESRIDPPFRFTMKGEEV